MNTKKLLRRKIALLTLSICLIWSITIIGTTNKAYGAQTSGNTSITCVITEIKDIDVDKPLGKYGQSGLIASKANKTTEEIQLNKAEEILTSDEFNVFMWTLLLAASIALMLIIISIRRDNKKQENKE